MIRVENITKVFPTGDAQNGSLRVLRGISFDIHEGEIIAIVGASGAGKSTLLHILGTLDRPTSGKVLYHDQDVFAYNDERVARFRNQHVGFVFQFHHLLPEFTVLENVCLPALILGRKLHEVQDHALTLLREVGVESKASSKPAKLSGGEQQRVAVARALMNSPKVVLADEPSGNLDTANAQQLHDLIRNLSKKNGQTFVIVTHNESFARQADRIIKLVDGVIAIS
jgi:lipoprotein-releasing system ATP-binding protein